MKTVHRQAARAKRQRWTVDPLAWAHTITASQDQQPEHADKVFALVRTACDMLKAGTATTEHFERVASAFNVSLVRAELIDEAVVDVIKDGIAALERCDAIWQRHRKYGFHGPDLDPLESAMEMYEQILRLSTPRLMQDAVEEVARRMLQQSQ